MGDLFTQVTIWLALGLFAGAQVLSHGRPSAAFRLSLTGLILFVAHAASESLFAGGAGPRPG